MMRYALLAILCLITLKSVSRETEIKLSENTTTDLSGALIAQAVPLTGGQDSLIHKIVLTAVPEIASDSADFSNRPEKRTFTEGDTSKTMGTLYKINTFMEWYIKFFPVPIASYSEETNLLIGLSKYNAFTLNRGDAQDTITQPSSISALAYYTLNTQHKFVLETNLMLNKNKALWKTDIVHTFYPLQYYGVGNDTELEDIRTLNSSDFQFSTHYLFKTWKNWYIGPAYDFYYYYDVELADGTLYEEGDSIDLQNNIGRQSGLGINISMEGRDNRLNAKAGFFVDATFQVYDEVIGSEYNFNIFNLDLRYYITPIKNLTIATQVRTQAKTGYIPVQSLSLLGGDYNMRGSYLGRYRDKNLVDSQLELRFPIFWIFGGTVFGGVGQVAPSYNKMALDAFHYTYGLGARLKVDSVHDINLRFDIGMSNDQHIFIMNFAESF